MNVTLILSDFIDCLASSLMYYMDTGSPIAEIKKIMIYDIYFP